MFGWIGRIWQWGVSNVGDPVSSWVRDFVSGIFGWLHTFFGHVGDAWHQMYIVGALMASVADTFGHAVWEALNRLFHITIPQLIHWAWHWILTLRTDIVKLTDWAARQIAALIARIAHAINSAIQWVITHVYDPLAKDISQAWRWITHEGATVVYYITHPDKLVALIWDALIAQLERTAWDIGGKLGKFFLALIVHNLTRFVLLIEDIVLAVF